MRDCSPPTQRMPVVLARRARRQATDDATMSAGRLDCLSGSRAPRASVIRSLRLATEMHHAGQNMQFDLQFVCKLEQLISQFTDRLNQRVLRLRVCLKVALDFQLD
jgi:hypothetical protein